jgi:hypothetical protein
MNTWTLEFDAPTEFLTANVVLNANRQKSARITKTWRERAYVAAKQAKLPTGLTRIRVDAVLRFPTIRTRDTANYEAALKPVIDALGPARTIRRKTGVVVSVGYGLIPDDNPTHLDGPYIAFGERLPKTPLSPAGRVLLTITDLSGEDVPA